MLNGYIPDQSPYWDANGLPIHEHIPGSIETDVWQRTFGDTNYAAIMDAFMKGRARGPESSKLAKMGVRILFGFHRLAINGLNPESDQPISQRDIHLICNGEIYNYRELYAMMGVEPKTGSDCEVILHLYRKYGIEQTLAMLDGVFSFVLLDQSVDIEHPRVYVARDPHGVRPLYVMTRGNGDNEVAFASELKMLYRSTLTPPYTIRHFTPGTFSEYALSHGVSPTWQPIQQNRPFFLLGMSMTHSPSLDSCFFNKENILNNLRRFVIRAVEKRCQTTERPVACLLSGGLDSSLIAAIVSNYREKNGMPPVETYSIGLEGSEDLKYAKLVAAHLGTNHTEVVLTESDFVAAIPEVVAAIESYDTTTVRASIGNYLLGKYIAAHSSAKVIFNGDGADELMGGYLYMKACPDAVEFDRETRRLLREIHAFDVLRSDKSISSHGLEPRTPYLDRDLTQYYLSIPPAIRMERTGSNMEKRLIREAFTPDFNDVETVMISGRPFLPDRILWRNKEAFSDGVSGHARSLYQIIQEYTDALADGEYRVDPLTVSGNRRDKRKPLEYSRNPPRTSEQMYYRRIFEKQYHGANVLEHFWMPKYVEAEDASARTLAIYDTTSLP